ncbi:hypothetical protein [Azospirillum canadense]|uniref:hypothetical protein n=1 Tax=Azospirillum canadense TaxID=403962 RepID=UPI002225C0AA|nr:hypothetical protein [Azospirillum canadense]MCW2240374.1 hypothetical protein [Azospirillum canadense]
MGGGDAAILALLGDITAALSGVVIVVATAAGSWYAAVASWHAYERAQFNGDVTGRQIAVEYVVASALLGFAGFTASMGGVPFTDGGSADGYAVLQVQANLGGAAAAGAVASGNALLTAVFTFLSVVGRITQLRGLFAAYDLGRGRSETSERKVVALLFLGAVLADLSKPVAELASAMNLNIFQ